MSELANGRCTDLNGPSAAHLVDPIVALPVGERQQLLGLGDKSRGKVAWIHV